MNNKVELQDGEASTQLHLELPGARGASHRPAHGELLTGNGPERLAGIADQILRGPFAAVRGHERREHVSQVGPPHRCGARVPDARVGRAAAEPFSRVIIEKPFGTNLETALKLNDAVRAVASSRRDTIL